eukprot:scaffold124245_cov29-Tisochrysis_lutea.AAC.3
MLQRLHSFLSLSSLQPALRRLPSCATARGPGSRGWRDVPAPSVRVLSLPLASCSAVSGRCLRAVGLLRALMGIDKNDNYIAHSHVACKSKSGSCVVSHLVRTNAAPAR